MIRRTSSLARPLIGLLSIAALGFPASGLAATPEQNAVIGAATDFSVAYGAWLWEKKCNQLPPSQRAAFDATIQDDLRRLSQAADLKLFNAAVGAGQDTANDPSIYKCDDPKAAGFAEFGLKLARDAAAKLSSLPPGYHLTITD